MLNCKIAMGVIISVGFALLMMILATQPSYADWNMSFQNCDEKGTWCWSITVPVTPPPPPYTPDFGHGRGFDWYNHYHHHHNAWCIWGHQAKGIMDSGQMVSFHDDYATGISHMIVNTFWNFHRQTFSCVVDPRTPVMTYHCSPVPW